MSDETPADTDFASALRRLTDKHDQLVADLKAETGGEVVSLDHYDGELYVELKFTRDSETADCSCGENEACDNCPRDESKGFTTGGTL